jgi:hypothetical protein
LAVNVGSAGCLQAVGVESGLIGGECEPRRLLVGAEREPKTPLVCEPTCHCLQATTAKEQRGRLKENGGALDSTLERLIEHVHTHFSSIYLGAIPQLLNNEAAFLSFICICTGIEALAGFRHPDVKTPGPRFEKFVAEYFLPPYKSWSKELWSFRNNMVHAFNPGKDFILVHHQSHNHLRKDLDGRTTLNAEDFYAALLAATQAYFEDLQLNEIPQKLFKQRIEDPRGVLVDVGPLVLDL